MGEAKRRKKLDPNWGKGFGRNQSRGKAQKGEEISRNSQSREKKGGAGAEKLPESDIALIANEEWHSREIDPERIARMEDESRTLGMPKEIVKGLIESVREEHERDIEIVVRLVSIVKGEGRVYRDKNRNPASEVTAVIKEMAEMILADPGKVLSGKREPFEANEESIRKVKKIGRRLNELGGSDLMRTVASEYVPRCDQKELELIWHGIGDWKA